MADETTEGDAADPGALRTAREEGRATLDAQLDALDDVDDKALAVFRLDIALVGALVSVLTFAVESDVAAAAALVNPATGVGVGLFALSAAAAGLTYVAVGQHVGVGPAGLDPADRRSERAYLAALVDGYGEWIRANERATRRKALLVTLSIFGTTAGALALAVGAVLAFTGRWLWPTVGALAVLVAFALLAGVPRAIRRSLDSRGQSVGAVAPQSLDGPFPGQRVPDGPEPED